MAQRRLFSLKIVESDAFLDMPISTQALYFHLCMHADDDGFVNPKKILRMIGGTDDDLKVLIGKRFVLPFETGIIVIKHWLIHNTILKDRYAPTLYTEEKSGLIIKDNKSYTESNQNVNKMLTQVKLSKVKLSKVNEATTADKLKKQFFNHPLFNSIKQSFPNRNYELEFDLMVDWWVLNKKKLPKNIAAYKNWLANTKPTPINGRIIREMK